MAERSGFAGGDQTYLRDVQYRDGSKLDARARIHRDFATSPISFMSFEAALTDWPSDAAVLECGCGTGRFWTAPELPRNLRLTLTDLSAGMVDEAIARARSEGFGSVSGRHVDAQSLPWAANTFDVVIANHMLYHVPDPDLAIRELSRVLRPDGVLLAATNGYGHMREINDAVAEVFGDHGEALYEVFGIDTGERRLREAFGAITWHAFDNDLVVDDPQAVIDYGLSFPPGEFATAPQRAAFAARVHEDFSDGAMRIRTRAGVFVARRPR